MAKNKDVSFAKFSPEVQNLFLEQFSDSVKKTENGYEFISGKAPRFQDFSDKIKAQLKKEGEVRKQQELLKKQELELKQLQLKQRKSLENKVNSFKTEHFLAFGTLPDEKELNVFINMNQKAFLTEQDFENVGMKTHKDTYTIQSKEYRVKTRDEFNSPVKGEFGSEKDQYGDVLLVGARGKFLKNLGSNYSDALITAGLSQDQVKAMSQSGACPHGFNVHHKKPIHGGGTNDMSNFVLIRDNLYHKMIHIHLDAQIAGMVKEGESKEVKIAAPDPNVLFFDNPKNMVTEEQNNENIKSGKANLPDSSFATKKNNDYQSAIKDLSTEDILMLAAEITKLKAKIHKGNNGRFKHYNMVVSELNKEYCHRTDSKDVHKHTTKEGDDVYYKKIEGKEPGIVFIHGTQGSMDGAKVKFLEEYCKENGLSFLSMDLPGHKRSVPPEYKDCTISKWTNAAQEIIESHTTGKQMIVGASMGGWLALNIASKMPDKVTDVVGLAAAPDYTERMVNELSEEQKKELYKIGLTRVYSDFSPNEGEELSRAAVVDGKKNLLLQENSPTIRANVVLLQGAKDTVVKLDEAESFTKKLKTIKPIDMKVIDGAGHGLGRPQDLSVLQQVVDSNLASFTQQRVISNSILSQKARG